jgi:hypothetical protein
MPHRKDRTKSGSQRTRRWREMDSNPRSPGYGGARFSWRRATRPMPLRNADRSRRRVRRAISAMPGATFTWTKAGVEIGFRDFEHLVAPFSPSRQRWKSVGTIGFVTRSECQNSGRKRDPLIAAETSLIARFNSLQGRKKFPVGMRRELARKKLISCPFSLSPRHR